jgi:hypothetical protein
VFEIRVFKISGQEEEGAEHCIQSGVTIPVPHRLESNNEDRINVEFRTYWAKNAYKVLVQKNLKEQTPPGTVMHRQLDNTKCNIKEIGQKGMDGFTYLKIQVSDRLL